MTRDEVAEIFHRFGPMVFRRARQLLGRDEEAKDVMQEVFITAMQEPARFAEPSEAKRWLYRVTRTLSSEEQAELEADLIAGCEARRARLLERFDVDGDGALSQEEAEAAKAAFEAEREEKRAEKVAEYDADGDGELSREERQAMIEARRGEMLERFDADGNGRLEGAEREALAEAIREGIQSGYGARGPRDA